MSRGTTREINYIILDYKQIRELIPGVMQININMVLHWKKTLQQNPRCMLVNNICTYVE